MKKLLLTILTILITSTGTRADSLTNGLVAYFPLNGNANDESGNGHHGTIVANGGLVTLTNGVNGMPNSAYRFAGGNDPNIQGAGINLSNSSMTITMWFKKDYTNYALVHGGLLRLGLVGPAGGETGRSLHIYANFGAPLRFSFFYDDFDIVTPLPVGNGKWSHIACTFDNVTMERRIYIDGSLIATNIAVRGFSGPTYFDLHAAGSGGPGLIDQVRFYSRVLSPAEISRLFTIEGPSKLSIQTAAVRMSWFAQSNVTYQVQWTTNFQTWSNLTSVLGADNDTNFVDWVDGTGRYYRLVNQ